MSGVQRVYSIDDFKDVASEVFGNVLGRDEYKLEVYKRRKRRMVWGYIWLRIGMVNAVQFDKEDEQYMDMLIEIDKNRHITLGSIKSRKFAEWHGHDGDTLCTIYWREKNRTVRCLCEYYKLVIKFVRIDKDGVLIHFEAYEKVSKP